ncbi:atp-dependent rna helicase [Ceraceosorus bombacis]|uniref:Atp-dependent rna helicase n=1 Tax=Ceraceosorus bombacis TaxID=401625 RepID=A0A0N7LAF8_9BASI|nr:atp-dependent rna helicase [Ceraceosorus bombacis]
MPRLARLNVETAKGRSQRLRPSQTSAKANASTGTTRQPPSTQSGNHCTASTGHSLETAVDLVSPPTSPTARADPDDDPSILRRQALSSSAAEAVRASGAAWRKRQEAQAAAKASDAQFRMLHRPAVKLEENLLSGDAAPPEAELSSTPRVKAEPGVAQHRTASATHSLQNGSGVKPDPDAEGAPTEDASSDVPRTPKRKRQRRGQGPVSASETNVPPATTFQTGGGGIIRQDTAQGVQAEERQASTTLDHEEAADGDDEALNTVYAFCQSRKHLSTTYNTLRSSVEALLKRNLEIFDLAQLKSLCPDLISLAYVDTDALLLHQELTASTSLKGKAAERADIDKTYADTARDIEAEARELQASTSQLANDASLEGLLPAIELEQPPTQNASGRPKNSREEEDQYVLMFEFNDGTLLNGHKATGRGARFARQRAARSNEPMRGNPRRLPDIDPVKAAKGMKKLIDKRNFKFEQAVLELLHACMAKNEDPVQLLIAAAAEHVPVDPNGKLSDPLGETPRKRRLRLEHLMTHPEERPPITEVIDEMKGQKWWKDQIVPGGHRIMEKREPRHEGLTFALSQELVDALYATRKIEDFYLHQAEALNALDDGRNVIVSTSTSSGKSLIYQIPLIRALEEDSTCTAMYIFPTKALAQDQRRTLQELLFQHELLTDIFVTTYDGDTERTQRAEIRNRASVIFTNPDMLHQSILPNEAQWRRFLQNLRFVVVDELHCYNGLFGAHVSFIMRRLRRICAALGNRNIQFISCSATVANPAEHMQTLFGIEDVAVITEDGSPSGAKEWLIWNPPLIDDADPQQGRVSAYAEVSHIFRHLVERGVRTIIFTKVRRTCEIVMNQIRNDLLLEGRGDVAKRVMSYRSGYSPEDRRKIEVDMFKGQLLGIVATSALELGIDIGSLDAVIMLGFPYSISSLRQQAGRAGRRQKDSLAVLVGDPFPLDQHYMRNPDEVFNQPDAALTVDLGNDFVREGHLQCAAAELPIHPHDDAIFFGGDITALCNNRLEPDPDGGGFFLPRYELRPFPAREIAIRGARQETYVYVDDTPGRTGGARVMEEVETDRAIFEAFEGAVFMHQGRSFLCREISHDTRVARMVQANVNYHTRPRDHTDTDAVETHRIRSLRGTTSRAYYGHVRIETRVWGYFKVDRRANILDTVDVDCPPFKRDTKGTWIDVPLWLINALVSKTINAAAAIHAAEHAILSLTPMFVVTMAGDVRTECKVAEREYARKATTRKRPARLIFYDTPGQNSGVCAKAFEHLDGLIRIAISVIESCECLQGCPQCITWQGCAHANVVTSKVGALAVLRGLVGLEPFDADLPQQNEPGHAEGRLDSVDSSGHTICQATPVRANPDVLVEDLEEVLPPEIEVTIHSVKQEIRQERRNDREDIGDSTTFEEDHSAS